jgi:hypothetical protein
MMVYIYDAIYLFFLFLFLFLFFYFFSGSYDATSFARKMYKNGPTGNLDCATGVNVCSNTGGANTDTGTTNSYISIGGLSGAPSFNLLGSIDDGKNKIK